MIRSAVGDISGGQRSLTYYRRSQKLKSFRISEVILANLSNDKTILGYMHHLAAGCLESIVWRESASRHNIRYQTSLFRFMFACATT